jgi:hypothetical protein
MDIGIAGGGTDEVFKRVVVPESESASRFRFAQTPTRDRQTGWIA